MSGPQHPFPPNFGGPAPGDMRLQFSAAQRNSLAAISSPGQSSVGIASPQTYNVGVNMQPPADSPVSAPQMQGSNQPTPQQIQMHMQQQRQQQQASQQQQDVQQVQKTSAGPQQLSQQTVPMPQVSVSQQPSLQPHQSVSVPPSNQNVAASDVSMQSVAQAAAGVLGTVPPNVVPGQMPSQPTTATLCTLGQEAVQEIVNRLQDMFRVLKLINPPTGLSSASALSNENRMKLRDTLIMIKSLLRRLRIIYERVNDSNQLQGTEYMHIESLIPLKEEWDVKTSEERKTSEAYRTCLEECRELTEQVIAKNVQLKEIIDGMRRIIWEINTMLTMRKS